MWYSTPSVFITCSKCGGGNNNNNNNNNRECGLGVRLLSTDIMHFLYSLFPVFYTCNKCGKMLGVESGNGATFYILHVLLHVFLCDVHR